MHIRLTPAHGLLIVTLLVGLTLRVASTHWNAFLHGDITDDARAAASLITSGDFLAYPYDPSWSGPFYYDVERIGGKYLDQHPPVWPVLSALAAAAAYGTEIDLFHAFIGGKIVGVFAGIAVLLLAYAVALHVLPRKGALFLTGMLAVSWIMVDYSANGSLYMLQAAFFLLWILIALRSPSWKRALLLGAVTGLAYLENYQSVILVPAAAFLLLTDHLPWRTRISYAVASGAVAAAIVSPWLMRNAVLFGDPLMHQYLNSAYVYDKAGIEPAIIDGIRVYDIGMRETLDILRVSLTVWLPNNLYFFARKLFVLAPVLFLLFPFAFIDYLYDRKRRALMWPILIVLVLHVTLSAAWPIAKFRYFVPLLPLVLLVCLEHAHAVLPRRAAVAVTALSLLAVAALSYMTYAAVETHTYYYDGALTTDREEVFLRQSGYIPT